MEQKTNQLKLTIDSAMQDYFGNDLKRITHARNVTGFVEKLLETEKADPEIVIPAGLLHDIGIHEAERKYASASGHYQEIEGPPIARVLLTRSSLKPEQIEEICQIIGHHHSPGKIHSQNFKVLYDSDWLVNLKDEFDISDRPKLEGIIQKVFLTASGRKLARTLYLEGQEG